MPRDPLIGLVGKPSAGKSTTLNSLTDASSKVGNFPFGSTGVVQVLSRAADLLGLVPVFPVRNTTTFASGASEAKAVFRDCVLVNKSSTVGDVARKVMGDAPIAFVEGVGGLRVADDDLVAVGRNDILSFKVGRA